MIRTPEEWERRFKHIGALWIHSGRKRAPHALLTSGKHSNGFFNSELVMQDPSLLTEACEDLVELLHNASRFLDEFDRVVGPALGAITLAHEFARTAAVYRKSPCLRAYTEKRVVAGRDMMVFDRTRVLPGERVLLVEDVITTGKSVTLATRAVDAAGGIPLSLVVSLVNRSGLPAVDGRTIISLINRALPAWESADCPLCKHGSEAIRPKGKENWALLTA
ncbi:MAG: orotate phosphoribosyltransferase [Parcubacteria group bacterium]|nr:orotate phosphoribosyltransferase [Parcubacteria group bacterium]